MNLYGPRCLLFANRLALLVFTAQIDLSIVLQV